VCVRVCDSEREREIDSEEMARILIKVQKKRL